IHSLSTYILLKTLAGNPIKSNGNTFTLNQFINSRSAWFSQAPFRISICVFPQSFRPCHRHPEKDRLDTHSYCTIPKTCLCLREASSSSANSLIPLQGYLYLE